MKKFLALMLIIALLLGCVPAAMAAATIPTNAADANAPAYADAPEYTATVKDGIVTVTVNEPDGFTLSDVYLVTDQGTHIEFTQSGNAFVSNAALPAGESVSSYSIILYYPDGVSSRQHWIDAEDPSSNSVHFTIEQNGQLHCYDYALEGYLYNYYNDDFDVYYEADGSVASYAIKDGSYVVWFTKYGQMFGADYYDDESSTDYYWRDGQWYYYETGEPADLHLDPTTVEVPYAEAYMVENPAANISKLNPFKLEAYEDGSGYVYFGENMTAWYDAQGNLTEYAYSNLEGTCNVSYLADGTLFYCDFVVDNTVYCYIGEQDKWFVEGPDGWEELSELPKGVSMDNILPMLKIIGGRTWYPNNTVGVLGLSLRDHLEIGDKWYNVLPVDLTQEGTQTHYMVASNLFLIGRVDITVADGAVTVNYKLKDGHGYVKSECVKWFTSLEQITEEFLEEPVSDLAFGQAVSIADELGGADKALLFINNRVTYAQPYTRGGAELSRYWPNRDRWVVHRNELTELLEAMIAEQAAATDTDAATATDTDVATATDTDVATATDTDVATATDTDVATATDTDAK